MLSQTVRLQLGVMNYQRAAACLVLFSFLLYISHSLRDRAANPLDGCTFVYLDMGTNVGVQIRFRWHSRVSRLGTFIEHFRKLFQPSKFPRAKIIPVFERFFGKPEERDYSEVVSPVM